MLKKILSMSLCLTIMLLPLTACTKVPTVLVDNDNSPLMIYIEDSNEFLKYHIDNYNARHDEKQIEYEVFGYPDNMYEKIEKEFKQGKGPDLLFLDYYGFYMFKEKMGDFADMDELIERSPMFKMEDYNTNILDAAIVNNKREYIPISYDTVITISTKEDMEIYYPDATIDLDYAKYLKAIDKYLDDYPENVACIHCPIYDPIIKYQLKNYKSIEPTERLANAMRIAKKQENRPPKYSELRSNYEDLLFRGITISYDKQNIPNELKSNRSIFAEIYYTYNMLNSLGKHMRVFRYPSLDKIQKARPDLGFAISVYSDKKNKAMRFIEYMLSSEVQASILFPPRIPVNNEALDSLANAFFKNETTLLTDNDIDEVTVPNDVISDVLYIIKSSNHFAKTDISNIWTECLYEPMEQHDFFDMDFDTFIEVVNDNLDNYYKDKE